MGEIIKNAVIREVSLKINDRDVLDMWLDLDYGDSSSQGFGGYALYLPKQFRHHEIKSFAGHFIFRALEIAGVSDFDKLRGRSIRVKLDKGDLGGLIQGIGHIIKDDWFIPNDEFRVEDTEGEKS